MKKSIFIILPLILWAFAACDNDDSEWDSGNLGVNSVEGTWQRVGAYPKVLAIFGSDYTSTIQTFDVDDNLVTDYPGNPETLLCFKSSHRLHQPTPYRHVQHSVERQLGNAFHSKLHGTINRRRWSRLHLQREQFQQFNSYRLGNSLRTDTKGRLLDQCRFGHHIR